MMEDADIVFADERYGLIEKILRSSLTKRRQKMTFSDMLDHVFLHRTLGIPIFLTLLWTVFQFTYVLSEPFMVAFEGVFGWLGGLAGEAGTPLASLWADGICGGLGFVFIFIFPIFFLFLALALLDGSGYLPRAAFVMDRLMHRFGLHGKAFIPLLTGFGCTIPAILATRSIGAEKDRLLTILISPLISCSARLPVYVLIAGALFGAYAGAAVFSMYVLGILLAMMMALLFRRTIPALRDEAPMFMLELPPYRMPLAKNVFIYMWSRGAMFLRKAGIFLFPASLILWYLASYPWGSDIGSSYLGMLGKALEPLVAPLGFNWMDAVALLTGFFAKEIVVETFGILYGVAGEDAIAASLGAHMTPVTGFAFMAFTLIYLPCIATLAAVKAETGSWKWTGFLVAYELVLAYLVAAIIIGIGSLFM